VRDYLTNRWWRRSDVLRATAIATEVVRRGPNGAWPQQPDVIVVDGEVRLDGIGFGAPPRDVLHGWSSHSAKIWPPERRSPEFRPSDFWPVA